MKKNLATAMAAAMAFGAVVPAFAAEVETYALVMDDKGVVTVDSRKANGLELVEATPGEKVFTRAQAYNTNYTPTDYSDDTLKVKDGIVVKETGGDDNKLSTKGNNLYVIATKVKDTDKNIAKAEVAAANAEIAAYKAAVDADGKKIYKVEEKVATPMEVVQANFKDSEKLVEVTRVDGAAVVTGQDKVTYKFVGVDVTAQENLNDLFEFDTAGYAIAFTTTSADDTAAYYKLNEFKYVLNKYAAKFDVEKEETNATTMTVNVYKKGHVKGDLPVRTMVISGVANIDKDLVYDVPASADFTGHWAEKQILNAMLVGQVDASKTFRPNAGITRAEFAKMLCTILGETGTATADTNDNKVFDQKADYAETFHDVPNNEWYVNYVGFLQQAGVVQGDGVNFRPNDKITRQEVAVMVSNALNAKNLDKNAMIDTDKDGKNDTYASIDKDQLKELVSAKLADAAKIDAWADHSVYDLVITKDGVITGDGKNFNPTNNITRAEALVMVQRAAE